MDTEEIRKEFKSIRQECQQNGRDRILNGWEAN